MTMHDYHTQNTAQRLAFLSDILRDCSARGLYFSSNIYDRDNYQKIQEVAVELLALATAQPLSEIEPLKATIFSRPSPIPVSDAAVINKAGSILLIRRADNSLWAMPGGGLEVGESPAQGATREVLEETGISCEPISFVGVYDSRLFGTASRHHLYHFLFLCRPLDYVDKIDTPSHVHEVLEMDWFPEDALPDNIDSSHAYRILEAFRMLHGDNRTYFDALNTIKEL